MFLLLPTFDKYIFKTTWKISFKLEFSEPSEFCAKKPDCKEKGALVPGLKSLTTQSSYPIPASTQNFKEWILFQNKK